MPDLRKFCTDVLRLLSLCTYLFLEVSGNFMNFINYCIILFDRAGIAQSV